MSMCSLSRVSHLGSLVPGVRRMSSAIALSPAGRGLTWRAPESPRRRARSPSVMLTMTAVRERPGKQQQKETLRR